MPDDLTPDDPATVPGGDPTELDLLRAFARDVAHLATRTDEALDLSATARRALVHLGSQLTRDLLAARRVRSHPERPATAAELRRLLALHAAFATGARSVLDAAPSDDPRDGPLRRLDDLRARLRALDDAVAQVISTPPTPTPTPIPPPSGPPAAPAPAGRRLVLRTWLPRGLVLEVWDGDPVT